MWTAPQVSCRIKEQIYIHQCPAVGAFCQFTLRWPTDITLLPERGAGSSVLVWAVQVWAAQMWAVQVWAKQVRAVQVGWLLSAGMDHAGVGHAGVGHAGVDCAGVCKWDGSLVQAWAIQEGFPSVSTQPRGNLRGTSLAAR